MGLLAGITIGYMGLPLKNSNKIKVLETQMVSIRTEMELRVGALKEDIAEMRNNVSAIHKDLKTFMREWRDTNGHSR